MWPLLKAAYAAWDSDDGPRMGAALAYYTVFSLAPLLLIATALGGVVFGYARAQALVLSGLERVLSPENAQAIRQLLAQAVRPEGSRLANLVGGGALLVGALGVVAELEASLNQIWKVPARAGSLATRLRARLTSLAFVLAIGFLLLVSMIFSALVAALGRSLSSRLPVPEAVLQLLNVIGSFAAIAAMFATIYKMLPRVRIPWRDAWAGALSTALLFALGNFLLGIYIGKTGVASAYGAAGSLVAIMVWTYYCAQILYFGAELTRVRALARAGKKS